MLSASSPPSLIHHLHPRKRRCTDRSPYSKSYCSRDIDTDTLALAPPAQPPEHARANDADADANLRDRPDGRDARWCGRPAAAAAASPTAISVPAPCGLSVSLAYPIAACIWDRERQQVRDTAGRGDSGGAPALALPCVRPGWGRAAPGHAGAYQGHESEEEEGGGRRGR